MKLKDFDQVKTISDFLKDKDAQIRRLNKATSFELDSNIESGIVRVTDESNPVVFSKFKHIAMDRLKKDRQTALRKLIKLGVEV